jgi:hypothetical protein
MIPADIHTHRANHPNCEGLDCFAKTVFHVFHPVGFTEGATANKGMQ